jgi:hypothetical protein
VGVCVAYGVVRVVRKRAYLVGFPRGCRRPLGLVGDDCSNAGELIPGEPADDPSQSAGGWLLGETLKYVR